MTTPTKFDLINTTLSPIRFLGNSPKIVDSVNQRIIFIIKKLISTHEKWESGQKMGLMICNSIERIKTKAFDPSSEKQQNLFPNELFPLCDKLNNIIKSFNELIKYCHESKRQLEALEKLNKNKDEILFKTWTLSDFLNSIEQIIDLYEKEYKIKVLVNENIAHSKTNYELALHVSVWEYPYYVGTESNLIFKIITKECLSFY